MVKAVCTVVLFCIFKTVFPPVVVVFLKVFPVVCREAPVLSARIFVVYRRAGAQVLVENSRKRPRVAGIFVHQDRHIALYDNAGFFYGIAGSLELLVCAHLSPGIEKIFLLVFAVCPAFFNVFFAGILIFLFPFFPGSLHIFEFQVFINCVVYNPGILFYPFCKFVRRFFCFCNVSRLVECAQEFVLFVKDCAVVVAFFSVVWIILYECVIVLFKFFVFGIKRFEFRQGGKVNVNRMKRKCGKSAVR